MKEKENLNMDTAYEMRIEKSTQKEEVLKDSTKIENNKAYNFSSYELDKEEAQFVRNMKGGFGKW